LFDGFEAFRTPSEDDFRSVFTSGLVVPDANVLINLYRYSSEARDSLLSVLSSLGQRLWIPHQVKVEFWSVRDGVLRDPRGTSALTAELDKLQVRAEQLLGEWAKGRSLSRQETEELRTHIDAGFDAAMERIAEFDADGVRYLEDSANDPVQTALGGILAGKVAQEPAPDVLTKRIAEGHRRVEEEIPPGYKDKGKPGDAPVGDYLVWCELLDEAKTRDCDALFVTSDVKEDWWRRVREAPRGPRPELVAEMREVTGRSLFMVQPDGLLERARKLLNVSVSESSLENIERVQQIAAQLVVDGWTASAVAAVLDRLSVEAPVQASVLRRAGELGGFISRADVYRIAEYDADRSLRGFTRPVRRIVQAFQDRGLIPDGAEDLLSTSYDDETVGLAAGFTVPDSVVPFVLRWAEASDAED
jgi:hypothetical protein